MESNEESLLVGFLIVGHFFVVKGHPLVLLLLHAVVQHHLHQLFLLLLLLHNHHLRIDLFILLLFFFLHNYIELVLFLLVKYFGGSCIDVVLFIQFFAHLTDVYIVIDLVLKSLLPFLLFPLFFFIIFSHFLRGSHHFFLSFHKFLRALLRIMPLLITQFNEELENFVLLFFV